MKFYFSYLYFSVCTDTTKFVLAGGVLILVVICWKACAVYSEGDSWLFFGITDTTIFLRFDAGSLYFVC